MKTFGLILLALVMLVNGLVYQTGMAVERTAFDHRYYTGVLSESVLTPEGYAQMEAALPEIIQTALQESEFEDLTAEERERMRMLLTAIATALLDTFDYEWIKEHMDVAIEDLVTVISSRNVELTAVIELAEKKESLAVNLAARLAFLTPEDLAELEIPADDPFGWAQDFVAGLDLPDQLLLAEVVNLESAEALLFVTEARPTFRLMMMIPLAVFLLLYYLFFKMVGHAKTSLWMGGSLLVSALLFMSMLGALWGLAVAGIAQTPLDSPDMATMVLTAMRFTAARMMTVPLITAALAIAMIIGGIYQKRVGLKSEGEIPPS